MRLFLKKIRNRRLDNKGVALVTVIVAIGFIAALVSILLMTTLVNFKMKVVNERGKDTFYSAEQVLDEITIGLQRRVSDSLSSSYVEILENYNSSSYDNAQKKLLLQTKYYEKLWGYLGVYNAGVLDHQKYSVDTLEDFLKDTTKWHDVDGNPATTDDQYGAIITAVANDGTNTESREGSMVTYTDSGVVLKNVKVYYKDFNGFVSVIQTDIRLNYPEFDFAKSSTIADITEYSFVADSGAEFTTGTNLDIDGNVYADSLKLKNVNTTFGDENMLIVKHNIDTDGGSFTTGDDFTVWAESFIAKSVSYDIKGETNLSNDLNITGKDSDIKFSGTYNGYGSSTVDSNKSSAILINGRNVDLDLSNLGSLKLSGHAYLGMKDANTYHPVAARAEDGGTPVYDNVYTGESVAIKTDQLMYLVPAEAIGVDEVTGRSLYNSNPLKKSEYLDILAKVASDKNNPSSKTKYKLVSDKVDIPSLGCSLDAFIAYSTVDTLPQIYTHEVRVSDTSVNSIVYCYMVFADENAANNYFGQYYSRKEKELAKYTQKYIHNIKMPAAEQVLSAGMSYVSDSADTVDGISVWPATQTFANIVMQEDSFTNNQKFSAYTTKLIPNYTELKNCKLDTTIDNTDKVVFDNLLAKPVDSTKTSVQEYIELAEAAGANGATFGGVTISIQNHDGGKLMKLTSDPGGANESIAVLTTSNNYNVESSKVNLVISTGNVTQNLTHYNGVILCDGKLTLGGTATQTMTKDVDLVSNCLRFGFDYDGDTYAVASVLSDGNDYIYTAMRNGGTTDTTLTGLVTYENWKKE